MNSSQKSLGIEKKGWLTEGLIIASVPAFAYLAAFFYEFGYAATFGLLKDIFQFYMTELILLGNKSARGNLFAL